MAEGTVTRLAALKVLEELRPSDTVTICLPLFLAGGEGDRAFAKFYPTIAIDGCEKRCAARATELYSNNPAVSIVLDDVLAERGLPRPQGLRRLTPESQPVVDALAEAIAAEVDQPDGLALEPGRGQGAGAGGQRAGQGQQRRLRLRLGHPRHPCPGQRPRGGDHGPGPDPGDGLRPGAAGLADSVSETGQPKHPLPGGVETGQSGVVSPPSSWTPCASTTPSRPRTTPLTPRPWPSPGRAYCAAKEQANG